MHPSDILNFYHKKTIEIMEDPLVRREKQRQQLLSWQAKKNHEKENDDKKQARLEIGKIKHDLLEATKKERELEFRTREMVATEEPKAEEKKEEVPLVLVAGRWKRKKKKQN